MNDSSDNKKAVMPSCILLVAGLNNTRLYKASKLHDHICAVLKKILTSIKNNNRTKI